MNCLEKFQKDLDDKAIPIYSHYAANNAGESDVLNDIINLKLPASACHIVISKQLNSGHNKINFRLVQNGDLFIGIQHNAAFNQVTYVINNRTQEFHVEAKLVSINDHKVWTMAPVPIPLTAIGDYDNFYIDIHIQFNATIANNILAIRGYYGYIAPAIIQYLRDQTVLNIPLHADNTLRIVCGAWYLVGDR